MMPSAAVLKVAARLSIYRFASSLLWRAAMVAANFEKSRMKDFVSDEKNRWQT